MSACIVLVLQDGSWQEVWSAALTPAAQAAFAAASPRYWHEPPLALAKRFGVPQSAVALCARVSVRRLQALAKDARTAQRVRVAELEAILAQERLRLALQQAP